MQLYDPKKLGAPSGGLFNPKEKKRWVFLVGGLVLITSLLVWTQVKSKQSEAARLAAMAKSSESPLPTEIAVPKINVAALEAAASDERPEQRMVLPGEALEAGFAESGQIYDSVYSALGGRELDGAIASEIVAAPTAHRGQLFRVRCTVEENRKTLNPADPEKPRYFVRGRLEDGALVYFAVQEFVGLSPVPGDFARMDGLFVRVHREEVEGQWLEAPLFVGPRMYESSPKRAPVTELSPRTFEFVKDDSVEQGFQGIEEGAYWDLVSYVENLKPGTVDWSKVPVLDNATITELYLDGSDWRGKPVMLPVARLFDIWVRDQSDNPLRRERMVEGWFGRGDWKGQAQLAHFVAPWDAVPPGIKKSQNVVLRGFFYKNLAYTPRHGGVGIAPFFVVESVEEFIAPDAIGLRQMVYIVVGSLVLMVLVMFFLVRRDRARTEALEAELLRRRRERRQKVAQAANP